jgi:hypothetical protein
MGGVGSGNWYRFDKKTTTDECNSVDGRLSPSGGSAHARALVLLALVAGR